jgi:hypothetical protein
MMLARQKLLPVANAWVKQYVTSMLNGSNNPKQTSSSHDPQPPPFCNEKLESG